MCHAKVRGPPVRIGNTGLGDTGRDGVELFLFGAVIDLASQTLAAGETAIL